MMGIPSLRRVLLAAFALVFVRAGCLHAQTDAAALQNLVNGKRYFLRSFSADPVVKYRWADGVLEFDPPKVSTVAVLAPDTVKLKQTILTIAGKRFTLVIDEKSGKPAVSGGSAAKLVIDLGLSDPALVLPKLQDALFCADLKAAIQLLPRQFADLVPFHSDPSNPGHVSKPSRPGQFWYLEAGTWKNAPRDQLKTKEPQLLNRVNPEFSQDARGHDIHGVVTLAFVVDESGKVTSPWLLQGLGYGLDEAAEEALLQYTFTPAQVDGRGVGVVLLTTISFDTF